MDRVSQYRVARFSMFPPQAAGGHARYCLVANTFRHGVPHARILLDGLVPVAPIYPSTEQLLELFDSALRQNMLGPR